MMGKLESLRDARVAKALNLLGAARRERLDKADYEAFVTGLAEFPVELVERVCAELARTAPPEFGPRFPRLDMLREACYAAQDAAQARQRLLSAPKPEPADPERLAKFLADVKALAREKAMR